MGDVHAQPSDLDDCRALAGLFRQVRSEHSDALFLGLGDQHDKHDTMSVRVMDFWRQTIQETGPWAFLTGNHDQASPGEAPHAMDAYRDIAQVAWPTLRIGPLFLVSYCRDAETFAQRVAGESGLLVCHQELAGFAYEDGFEVRHGFSAPDSFVQVVSGHLHTPQERGKVWYPGSPRWRTRPDASVKERALWLCEISDGGHIVSRRPYHTNGVCRRTVALVDSAETPAELISGAECRVEVRGTADYTARRRAELERLGAKVRCVIERGEAPRVRESDGIEVSFRKFFGEFRAPNGTDKAVLAGMVQERLGLALPDCHEFRQPSTGSADRESA